MTKNTQALPDLPQMLDVQDLARILRRPIPTIYSQRTRSPEDLPPPCILPGCRRPMWHPLDVQNWIDQHRQSRQQEQVEAGEVDQPRRRGRPHKSSASK